MWGNVRDLKLIEKITINIRAINENITNRFEERSVGLHIKEKDPRVPFRK